MQSKPEYLLTKGQLIYCRSKWKAVEADKCQLSSGQGEPDICLVTIMAVGITYCDRVLRSWNAKTTSNKSATLNGFKGYKSYD